MPDFRDTRTSAARWRRILIPVYNELVNLKASDIWVYGSQAMSLYLKRPLASKDLDLLASGLTIEIVKTLCDKLAPLSNRRKPYFDFQNLEHQGVPNPVFSIYLSSQDEKPFALELFRSFNGHGLSELTPYTTYVKRWDNEFQTLTIEAIIGTRLAFRPPERISSFNAQRLNQFIEEERSGIDWRNVEEFARKFQLEQTIIENLNDLHRRGIKITGSSKLSFLSR